MLGVGGDWRAAAPGVCPPWQGCEVWRWPPGDQVTVASTRVPASTWSWVSATDAALLILCVDVNKGSSTAPMRLLGTLMPSMWAHVHMCLCAPRHREALFLPEVAQKHHPGVQPCVGLADTPSSGTSARVRSCLVLWPTCILCHVPTRYAALLGLFGDSRSSR